MQFSKFMPLVCAAAFCAGFITARADDTPAQAAARAALEEKMSELDAQAAATNAAAAAAITAAPSATAPEQPVTAAPAPVESQTPADSATQAAARAALDQKMQELAAQQASTNVEAQPMIATTPSVAAPIQAPAVTMPPANVNYPGKELGLKPIEAPPLPISADKEAQLQALLAKYMADQVSPEEYHKQRAAILAEP
jgi:hypothetical protein